MAGEGAEESRIYRLEDSRLFGPGLRHFLDQRDIRPIVTVILRATTLASCAKTRKGNAR